MTLSLQIVLLIGLIIISYSYFGYGLLVWLIVKIRFLFRQRPDSNLAKPYCPPVTLVIAAFNEEDFIRQKLENTLLLSYPRNLLTIIIITDGSNDRTAEIVKEYNQVIHLHETARKGKIAAIHRAMAYVKTPITVYSDANTLLNADCLLKLVSHYKNPEVGGVAGEKKVIQGTNETAGSSEGLYWKYESFLKKLDWQLYTVVGAAGEIFSVRTELYEFPGDNVILDDFVISLRVCEKGYRVAYEPDAYATELESASIKEEKKRKIRISAGGFQAMFMLRGLLNFLKHPLLSFQYISHRVLRWTLCPLFIPLIFICNLILVTIGTSLIFQILFLLQILFYLAAFSGWLLSKFDIKVSSLYAPYYLIFINYALYLGFSRYLRGKQSAIWEKATRKPANELG